MAGEDFDLDETADNAADEIIGSAPPPNEDAIAAMKDDSPDTSPGEQKPIIFSADKDAAGESWDAAKHTATKAKTAKGLWKKRRGTAKPAGINSTVQLPAADPAKERAALEAKARMAGCAASGSIFLLGSALGGPEWQPRQQPIDEKAMMDQAWGDYFVAKGVTDFPPGVALCMALVMYAAPRFTMPQTQQRARGLKAWIMLRIAKRKLKKELKKRGINAEVYIEGGKLFLNGEIYNGARANRRDVGERENNTREAETGPAV